MNPIRVSHLIGQLGRGGSERQLFLTVTHLDPNRVESRVVVFNPSPHAVYDERLRERGIAVHPVPASVRGVGSRALWLSRHLKAWGTEIVHSWTFHDNPYAALCGRLSGAIGYWGSLRGQPGASDLGLPRVETWLSLRGIQRLVVNAPHLERMLLARGYPAGKILTLPNCVEIRDAGPPQVAPELPFPAGTRLIGSVGNLRRVKNHRMFVRSLKIVLPRHPGVGAIIVGQALPSEPEIGRELERQIREAGLSDRVRLLGFREDVPALLRRLEVLCLTSTSEGTPNVLLEAMAEGCPIVATEVGGIPDLVDHERTGLLVPVDDEGALTDALHRLLLAPVVGRGLAARARSQVAKSHSCERVAARLQLAYEEAVRNGSIP